MYIITLPHIWALRAQRVIYDKWVEKFKLFSHLTIGVKNIIVKFLNQRDKPLKIPICLEKIRFGFHFYFPWDKYELPFSQT